MSTDSLAEVITEQIRVVRRLQALALDMPREGSVLTALREQIGALCQLLLHER